MKQSHGELFKNKKLTYRLINDNYFKKVSWYIDFMYLDYMVCKSLINYSHMFPSISPMFDVE